LPSYFFVMASMTGGCEDLDVREGVGDNLRAPVVVGVGVADEQRREALAAVQDLGDQAVAVGPREARVDEERITLSGDQRGGLVLGPDGEVEVDDLEVKCGHGRSPHQAAVTRWRA
jgi:hypothetical protein